MTIVISKLFIQYYDGQPDNYKKAQQVSSKKTVSQLEMRSLTKWPENRPRDISHLSCGDG